MDLDSDPSDEDFPDLDPEFKRSARKARDRWRLIYRKRGEFISDVNELEALLKVGVAAYFEQENDEFLTWVMARLGARDTLDVARHCVDEIGLSDLFADGFKSLSRGIDFRNAIAHSHVDVMGLYMGSEHADLLEAVHDPVSVRWTRKGVMRTTGLVDELNAERASLAAAAEPPWSMMLVMAMRLKDQKQVREMWTDLQESLGGDAQP